MALVSRFGPPAYLPDFQGISGQFDQWHLAISGWFDGAIKMEFPTIHSANSTGKGVVQFFNPASYDPGGPLVEQPIVWNAFPKELLRQFGREQALVEADRLWPLSSYNPRWTGPTLDRNLYRPQNEYCEWHVVRDPDTSKIRKVTFTSEPPEYWQALFGGTLETDYGNFPFTGDRNLVLHLYRQFVSPAVELEDLIASETIATTDGKVVIVKKGDYNPYNKWNTTHGIVHLCAPPNSLTAEIQLGADATVLRADRHGRLLVEPDALVCCAAYGGPDRNSDPTIGGAVNALARAGAMVTLRNPVGLYMDHIDLAGWAAPDGRSVTDCIRVERGTPDMIERIVVEVPGGRGFTLGDLKIGGELIRFGGQIAECISVKLIGVAGAFGQVQNSPAPCKGRCCIDPAYPTILDRSVPYPKPIPSGTVPVFVREGEEEKLCEAHISGQLRVAERPLLRGSRTRADER